MDKVRQCGQEERRGSMCSGNVCQCDRACCNMSNARQAGQVISQEAKGCTWAKMISRVVGRARGEREGL